MYADYVISVPVPDGYEKVAFSALSNDSVGACVISNMNARYSPTQVYFLLRNTTVGALTVKATVNVLCIRSGL